MSMLVERNVALTSIAGLSVGAGMFAAIFYVPLFMQAVVGTSSADSGLALVQPTAWDHIMRLQQMQTRDLLDLIQMRQGSLDTEPRSLN